MIKPTFTYLISPRCYHLQGPPGVKNALQAVQSALNNSEEYTYVIRADVRGYYASISRVLLLQQLNGAFCDSRLQHYFDQIVNHVVCRQGDIITPSSGIPVRSTLSPFFGALYLSGIDRAFENRKGIQYFRYMDDIVILAKTKRHYQKAKKRLYALLRSLKLALAPKKTWMGKLTHGFHFLGVAFVVSQNPQTPIQVTARIHARSCRRAMLRIQALADDAEPATQQRYLSAWAAWWSAAVQTIPIVSLLQSWFLYATSRDCPAAWLALGMLRYCLPNRNELDGLSAA